MLRVFRIVFMIMSLVILLYYFSISTRSYVSPEYDLELERVATIRGYTKYLVFDGRLHPLPTRNWSGSEYKNIYNNLREGDFLKVRFDEKGMFVTLQYRGEDVITRNDYYRWKAFQENMWLKMFFPFFLISAISWVVHFGRKNMNSLEKII